MSLEKVYEYFHNYDKQSYQVAACMGNEPSEQDIMNFENQYQITLPADFREFTMSPLGGPSASPSKKALHKISVDLAAQKDTTPA